MPNHYVTKTLRSTNRASIRRKVIKWFLKEIPGTGTGPQTSFYEYVVEKYSTYEIYIGRPAILNKGFDITVNVRAIPGSNPISFLSTNGRTVQNPSHSNIISILNSVKNSNSKLYNKVSFQLSIRFIIANRPDGISNH